MKKVKKLTLICFFALLIGLAVILGTVFGGNGLTANAATEDDFSNYIAGYDVTYDIESDRVIHVKEDLTFHFYNKSGFVREIPVNGGEQVKNIKVKELVGGNEQSVYYDVYSEQDNSGNDFIWVDMGSYEQKFENHTFRLTFDYIVPQTKDEEKNNIIALTPVGSGFEFKVENINITLILPNGYIGDGLTQCYTRPYGLSAQTPVDFTESTNTDGRTELFAHIDRIARFTEVRFDVHFEEGAITTHFDFTPYIFIIVAAVILLILVAVKFLCFNKAHVTPVVNFEAPNKMDPLLMGKLIDTKVDSADITSMIFYFADKGYLKINLENQSDPALIRLVQNLPETCTDYERVMFHNLFAFGEVVHTSQLQYRFYKTVERVTAMVNGKVRNKQFTGGSVCAAWVFALIAGLLLGIAPFAIALLTISLKYMVFIPFASLFPAFIIFVLSQSIKMYEFKFDRKKKAVFATVVAIVCAVFIVLYVFLIVPNWIMGWLPKLLLSVICCGIVALSTTLISRSKEYIEQLNEIVGFKNFILLAEKNQLETMLEDDPQFYYHVLPYAQVLGVSDKWEEKFKDLTVAPPQWATGSFMDTAFRFHVFNSILNRSMSNMSRNMVSKPSSGASGGGHGSFGGHGGGHGGGGGHFR